MQPLGTRDHGTNGRTMVLFAFALYLVGASLREVTVLANHPEVVWGTVSIVFSCVSRALQVAGATLFVGAVTYRECSHWVWGSFLVVALLFGAVMRIT